MNFHRSERPPPRENFYIVDPSSSETRHLYRNEKHGAQMHRTDRELVHINYRHCKPAQSLPARCSMSPPPRLTIAERFMSIRNQDSPSFNDCTRQREQTEDNKGDKEKHNEQVEENVQEEETVHYLDIPTHQHRHDPRKQHLVDGIKRSVSPTRSINKDHIASSPSQHSVVHPIHEPAHSSFQDPPPGFGTKHDVEAATTDGRQEKTSRAPSMQQRGREQRRFRHAACAVILFTLILALAVGIFVSWPRKPLIRINGSATLTVAPKIFKTEYVNVGNVAFETGWLVRATIDSSDNYIPLPFAPDVVVKDALTSVVVGRLDAKKYEVVTIPPQTLTDVMLPIHIDYEARDVSDTTFSNLRRGCLTDKRESLQLQFWITLHFPALDSLGYRPSLVALPATGGFACPQA